MQLIKLLKSKKAYSLIEVMVSLAISSGIILSTVITLSNLLEFNRKAQVTSEVTQNMQYSVEVLKRKLRQVPYDDFTFTGMDNLCNEAQAVAGTAVIISDSQKCGTSLTHIGRKEVFGVQRDAVNNISYLYVIDGDTGNEVQLTPDTIDVQSVSVKLDQIDFSNGSKSIFVSLDIRATDAEGILMGFAGESENESVTVNTGVFLRRTSN